MITIEEIQLALEYMNDNWPFQNNDLDAQTKFIYTADTVDEIRKHSANDHVVFNYAIHRWYNLNCAKMHENFFIENGAVKEDDLYHKTIDFYLFEIPFDLKTTVFPKKNKDKPNYDLNTRIGKNNLIEWMYENQSKEGRFHLENRLFIVCSDMKKKSDFTQIRRKIKSFIEFSKQHGFNTVKINGKDLCSDIIWIQ